MPKFTPKSEKKEEEEKTPTQAPPKEKEHPKSLTEEEERVKLRELESKFGSASKPGADKGDVWKTMKETSGEQTSMQDKMTEYEISRRAAPPPGSISRDDPDFISKDELEKRRRELNMAETRLRTLEKEEQDINQRLDYLRKEHSAMELAIKEKAHLEREIAELREDRDRVKAKLDELKTQETQLEQKTWEDLKRSPAIGAKIAAIERRIHELEGQILELNEQRLRGGLPPVSVPVQQSVPTPSAEKREPEKAIEEQPEVKPEPAQPKEEPKPVPQPVAEKKEEAPLVAPQKKKTRLSF